MLQALYQAWTVTSDYQWGHLWHPQSFCETHFHMCVGNIMQLTLDCMINLQWRGMFSLQSGVRDSVYVCVLVTMRQCPLGWNNVWLGVCAWVGVSPWFINVGFSTTWAHSSSSTHCNATGTHTCCPAQGQWGEAIGETGLKHLWWPFLAQKVHWLTG